MDVFSYGKETASLYTAGNIDVALFVLDDHHVVSCAGARLGRMGQVGVCSQDPVHVPCVGQQLLSLLAGCPPLSSHRNGASIRWRRSKPTRAKPMRWDGATYRICRYGLPNCIPSWVVVARSHTGRRSPTRCWMARPCAD